MFSSQVTKLEIELVKAKQELGDALNHAYEMEKSTSDHHFTS
jgi:acyl-ACP thioesterase